MKTIKAFRVSITQQSSSISNGALANSADDVDDNDIAKGIIKCIFLKEVTPLFVVIKVEINRRFTKIQTLDGIYSELDPHAKYAYRHVNHNDKQLLKIIDSQRTHIEIARQKWRKSRGNGPQPDTRTQGTCSKADGRELIHVSH